MNQIVIIGNSAAGIAAAQTIRKNNSAVKITMISEEPYLAYSRYMLADFLAGTKKENDLLFCQKDFYQNANITLMLGKKVERVNTGRNVVILTDKTKIEYDSLIIASGFSIKMPKELKGANKHGVLGVRSINNIKDINELLPITHLVCIWGGGVAGLSMACALHKKGILVKIVSGRERLLSGVIDENGAEFFKNRFLDRNIEVISGINIVEVFGEADVKAIKLDTGKVIGCGIVLVDNGYCANVKFLEETEVKVGNGIITDSFMRSNIPNVFAAGDVVQRENSGEPLYDRPSSWASALAQGAVAGNNALLTAEGKGQEMSSYEKLFDVTKIEFFNLPAVSLGLSLKPSEGNYEEVSFVNTKKSVYKKMVLQDSKVVGFTGIGAATEHEVFLKLICNKIDVGHIKNLLLCEQFNYDLFKDLV